jgi:RNA-directed DNA polymerase
MNVLSGCFSRLSAPRVWLTTLTGRAKTDRLDTELLMRAFLGWLRGEKRHCSMAAMLEAGYEERGQKFATPRGTPQGGVVSPLLSNILLTPFDKEMRRQGYKLTRWADDWVVTCRTRAEAEHALVRAVKILEPLGVALNQAKTRIVHITRGFEFLGFKIQRGKGKFLLTADRIKSKLNRQNLYAIPTQKSVDRFKDQIRTLTQRKIPLRLGEVIETINPIIRGWGNY